MLTDKTACHFVNVGPASLFCDFHVTRHLLCRASGGGATNSLPHVLNMGVSYSRYSVFTGHWTLPNQSFHLGNDYASRGIDTGILQGHQPRDLPVPHDNSFLFCLTAWLNPGHPWYFHGYLWYFLWFLWYLLGIALYICLLECYNKNTDLFDLSNFTTQ